MFLSALRHESTEGPSECGFIARIAVRRFDVESRSSSDVSSVLDERPNDALSGGQHLAGVIAENSRARGERIPDGIGSARAELAVQIDHGLDEKATRFGRERVVRLNRLVKVRIRSRHARQKR